jgi:hypothetical protein
MRKDVRKGLPSRENFTREPGWGTLVSSIKGEKDQGYEGKMMEIIAKKRAR